ncbi:hypothetical protein MASR2M47_28860 [Draconibacterium sp.]|jgi:hypothetical protein
MKKLFLIGILAMITSSSFAQFTFDLGVKGGVNFSKISFDVEDYSAESVTKTHFGAFARLGGERVYIQPEFYFSGKGGDVTSDIMETAASFDYKTFDIPVLLGIKLIDGKSVDLNILGGPVFSNITSKDIAGDNLADKSFYENNYYGIQYGLSIDVLFLTFDARMENGLGDFYKQADVSGKNQNFMISVGFRFF